MASAKCGNGSSSLGSLSSEAALRAAEASQIGWSPPVACKAFTMPLGMQKHGVPDATLASQPPRLLLGVSVALVAQDVPCLPQRSRPCASLHWFRTTSFPATESLLRFGTRSQRLNELVSEGGQRCSRGCSCGSSTRAGQRSIPQLQGLRSCRTSPDPQGFSTACRERFPGVSSKQRFLFPGANQRI